MASASSPMFGIDLGTSESRIAVWKDGQIQVIPTVKGQLYTPSYVTFTGQHILAGDDAKNQVSNPENTVFYVKRLIGRDGDGTLPGTTKFHWPFQVSIISREAHMVVRKGGKSETYSPEQIMHTVLDKMLKDAKMFMNLEVNRVVMTVPTYFNEDQRERATMNVAKMAKVNLIHVIDSSTAAALAYCFRKNLKDAENILVYDMGTYVFQAALLNVKDLNPEVVASDNFHNLGGRNLDQGLLSHCFAAIMKDSKLDLRNDIEARWKLFPACEEAKKKLSFQNETIIRVDNLCKDYNFNFKISRQKFESLSSEVIKKTLSVVGDVLSTAKVEKSKVKHVVLVGGSSRIPKLREVVKDYFNLKELDHFIDPEEAIVYGSAVQGALLNKSIKIEDMRKMSSENRQPHVPNIPKSNMPGRGPAVGIDLGTTCSCIAVWKEGRVNILFNDHGNRVTPSYVSFTEEERLVGNPAKQQMLMKPENTVFDAKRLIGRTYNDPETQNDIKSWCFRVVDEAGKPRIEIKYQRGRKRFYPEQISSMVLAYLKQTAESALRTEVTDAVVTVPAYFNDAQRQATKDAAQIAGLNVLRIINEPTAAAIAYGLENKAMEERTVLVYDLGGGTFDVTVLTIEDLTFKIRSTCGDTHLGGRDFDNRMVDFYVKMLKTKQNTDISSDRRAMQRLRVACEEAKEALSSSTSSYVVVDNICNGIDLNHKLTRNRFDDLCLSLFRKTLDIVQQALSDAKADKKDIHDVVLVGGSTRIPRIQAMVKEFFNGKELCKNVHPEESVAIGAAVQAAVLNGGPKDPRINRVALEDVIPMSLGIQAEGHKMVHILKKNTMIPCKNSRMFTTVQHDQNLIPIRIYEGENDETEENNFLDLFTLSGLSLKPAGVPKGSY